MKKKDDFIIVLAAAVIILIFLGFIMVNSGQSQPKVSGISTTQTP